MQRLKNLTRRFRIGHPIVTVGATHQFGKKQRINPNAYVCSLVDRSSSTQLHLMQVARHLCPRNQNASSAGGKNKWIRC